MLYNTFRFSLMGAAILGAFHMIANESYVYMFFPLAILFWVVYSFFEEDDKEYLRRNGYEWNDFWLFPDYYEDGSTHTRTYNEHQGLTQQNDSYKPKATANHTYAALKNKCKRNFKISIKK